MIHVVIDSLWISPRTGSEKTSRTLRIRGASLFVFLFRLGDSVDACKDVNTYIVIGDDPIRQGSASNF